MITVDAIAATGLILNALFIAKNVETGGLLGIVEVEEVAPEVASEMKRLGYDELTPHLFKAFRRSGHITLPAPGDTCCLRGRALQLSGGI